MQNVIMKEGKVFVQTENGWEHYVRGGLLN